MKRKLLLMVIVIFLLSGCSKEQNTPADVAKTVVKYLSSGNESKVSDYFYHAEENYFNTAEFVEMLEDKGLAIKDNEVVNIISSEKEDPSIKGYQKAEVKVQIEGGVFTLNTIRINGKWYVYDESFFDSPMKIVVPEGYQLYLNEELVDTKYIDEITIPVVTSHPTKSLKHALKIDDLKVKAYVLNNPIIGAYDVRITNGTKEIKDTVYTYERYGNQSSNNYTSTYSYTDGTMYYFSSVDEKENTTNFIKGYLKDIYGNVVEKHNSNILKTYFEETSETFSNISTYYQKAINTFGVKGTSAKYYDDFNYSNLEFHYINAYGDVITTAISYKLTYNIYRRYSSDQAYTKNPSSVDMTSIFAIHKSEDGKYRIFDVYNAFAY